MYFYIILIRKHHYKTDFSFLTFIWKYTSTLFVSRKYRPKMRRTAYRVVKEFVVDESTLHVDHTSCPAHTEEVGTRDNTGYLIHQLTLGKEHSMFCTLSTVSGI